MPETHHANPNDSTPLPPGKIPGMVVFLMKNAAFGFGAAIAFVGTLLALNVGNLTTLATQSGVGLAAIILMTFMIGLTFASIQMGAAVMLSAHQNDEEGPRSGSGNPTLKQMEMLGLRPARVAATSKRSTNS